MPLIVEIALVIVNLVTAEEVHKMRNQSFISNVDNINTPEDNMREQLLRWLGMCNNSQ